MANDTGWIAARIEEAQETHTSVTRAVVFRMTTQLGNEMSEGALSSTELTTLAKALITDMLPSQSEAKVKE